MKSPAWSLHWGLALLLGSVTWLRAAQDAPGPALPLEPVTAILERFSRIRWSRSVARTATSKATALRWRWSHGWQAV